MSRAARDDRTCATNVHSERKIDSTAAANNNKVKVMATQLLAKFEENAPAQHGGLKRQVGRKTHDFIFHLLQLLCALNRCGLFYPNRESFDGDVDFKSNDRASSLVLDERWAPRINEFKSRMLILFRLAIVPGACRRPHSADWGNW